MLWLWCRPAYVALIRPLAWEPPYAAGVALKRQKKKKEKKKKKKKKKKKRCRHTKNNCVNPRKTVLPDRCDGGQVI